jgi:hypothetical protein
MCHSVKLKLAATKRQKLKKLFSVSIITRIRICFGSVTILQSVRPSAFIFCRRCCTLSHTITAFESLRPFASIYPTAPRLNTQSMSLSILPLAFKRRSTAKKVTNKLFLMWKILYSSAI